MSGIKVEGRDFLLGIEAGLITADEADTDSRENSVI
jgi:hypothetical protein